MSIEEISVLLLMFFLYCILGWIWESIYMSILEKRVQNRGFLHGPYIPVYGVAGMVVYFTLGRFSGPFFSKNTIYIYFIGMFFATTIEYITAVILDRVFHDSWWDYSIYPLNYKGRICVIASLFWGLVCVLFVQIINPIIGTFFSGVSSHRKTIWICVMALIMAMDTFITVVSIVSAHNQSEKEREHRWKKFYAEKKHWIIDKTEELSESAHARMEGLSESAHAKMEGLSESAHARMEGLSESAHAKMEGLSESAHSKMEELSENAHARIEGAQAKLEGLSEQAQTKMGEAHAAVNELKEKVDDLLSKH